VGEWKKKITAALDIPEDALSALPRVTLTGNGTARIEHPGVLLCCTGDAVETKSGRLRLKILGSGLRLRAMEREELLISGLILSVEVEGA